MDLTIPQFVLLATVTPLAIALFMLAFVCVALFVTCLGEHIMGRFEDRMYARECRLRKAQLRKDAQA